MGKKKRSGLRDKKIRRYYPGRSIALIGAVFVFVWAVWEFAIRVDAIDGMTQAYFKLVWAGDITLARAFENLADTPEALHDLITLGYLLLSALFGVVAFLLRNKPAAGLLLIPGAFAVGSYDFSLDSLFSLNLFSLFKFIPLALIVAGSTVNILSYAARRGFTTDEIETAEPKRAEISSENQKARSLPSGRERAEVLPVRRETQRKVPR